MAGGLSFWLDALLLGYARIFFAGSRLPGAAALLATCTVPALGLSGLLGGACSSLCALLVGMDRDSVKKGVYGLNGVLVGLGLGCGFAPSPAFFAVLLLACLLLTLVTVALNAALHQLAGLPALSLPFNLLSWVVAGAAAGFGGLRAQAGAWEPLALPAGVLPEWLGSFSCALGSVLFLPRPLAGLLVACGLLLWSRLALLLLLAGFAANRALGALLGVDPLAMGGDAYAFNHMLAALAIGGIFAVPGPGSLLLGALAAALSSFLLGAALEILPANLSPLALPFNLAVLLTLHTLRLRLHPSLGVRLAPFPPGSPEENLGRTREDLRAWRRWGLTLSLPFQGEWKVTQGVDGGITHRGDWRFAYDFQRVDGAGATCRAGGGALEDHVTWGAPVLSPAAGTVHTVVDGVADNAPGCIDAARNWGNCVVIAHAEHYYSCLAHLRRGSVLVKPGEVLARGQPVALAGNSGRSPYPHLHLQVQMVPQPGAPALAFSFGNILVRRQGLERFVSTGGPAEGETARNAEPAPDHVRFFPYALGGGWPFVFRHPAGEEREMWEGGVDFHGNTHVVSYPRQTRLYYLLQDGLLTVRKLEGSRDSGLHFLGTLLAEAPFLAEGEAAWTTTEAADHVLRPWAGSLLDSFSLLGLSLRHRVEARMSPAAEGRRVTTASRLVLDTPLGALPVRRLPEGELLFGRDGGLLLARAGARELRRA